MKMLLDRSSSRRKDEQGFLHVAGCNISKACVNPYYGHEIPDWESRGLDPKRVYKILRTPEELEKAAPTFNNLPLLDTHVEVSALDLQNPDVQAHVVGSVGTDVAYSAPHLVASLTIYKQSAIDGVETGKQMELSCAYRYDLDMTPGEHEGHTYDGRMLNIIGNHVALVEEGRAGHDVIVADAALAGDSKATNIISKLLAIKSQITSELKTGVVGEAAEVLDDLTGALDVAVHHLLDFEEKSNVMPEHAVLPAAAPADSCTTEPTPPADSCTTDITEREDVNPEAGKKEYGEVQFADPKNKKYPIDTPEHVRSALGYWGRQKNRNKYSKEDQDTITKRIEAAAKRHRIGGFAADQSFNLDKEAHMAKKEYKLSPRGHAVVGALSTHVCTKLAADKALQPGEMAALIKSIAPMKFSEQRHVIADAVAKHFKGRLANDGEVDINELEAVLEELEEEGMGEDIEPAPMDPGKALLAAIEALKPPPEALAQISDLINKLVAGKSAADEELTPKKEEEVKPEDVVKSPAMDAALKQNRQDAVGEVAARFQAAKEVEPIVGAVDAMAADSAASIYKLALDAKSVPTEGVDPANYKAMVNVLKVSMAAPTSQTQRLTADKAAADEFDQMFPNVKNIKKL